MPTIPLYSHVAHPPNAWAPVVTGRRADTSGGHFEARSVAEDRLITRAILGKACRSIAARMFADTFGTVATRTPRTAAGARRFHRGECQRSPQRCG